ncbi:MAG: CDP-alcohol phosphatidyltransferase family protein [Flavobacteriales bacterium]|nr:CDP-alcohol phosphatidyltransferase family protein [Flavobacteriales bacterium]
MKKHIPNIITLGNLSSGLIAVVLILNGYFVWAGFFTFLGAFFDFFDGMVARLLGVSGELGKQMDSLADMVSFGVVPGMAMFMMLKLANADLSDVVFYSNDSLNILINKDTVYALPGFLITLFSALRLANFNIDTRQSSSFIGVPTPAITLFVLSIFLISVLKQSEMVESFVASPWMLYLVTVLSSYALVAELPLFAMKFKVWNWQDNKIRWIFVAISLVLLLVLQLVAIPLIIVIYVLLSIINNFIEK